MCFLSKSPGGQDDHNVDVYLQVKHRSQAPLKKRSFHIGYPVVRGQGAWSREYQNFFGCMDNQIFLPMVLRCGARAPLSLNLSFFLYALKVERDFETKINMKSKRSSYPRPVCFCSPGWYTVSDFSGKFSNSLVKQLSATKTKPWYPALFISWFLLLFISVVNYGWIAETTKTFLAKIGLVIDQTETNSFCGRIELKNTFAFSSFNGMFWIWVFF